MGPVTGTIYLTCRKTMNKGMVDRGFAVLKRIAKKWLVVGSGLMPDVDAVMKVLFHTCWMKFVVFISDQW